MFKQIIFFAVILFCASFSVAQARTILYVPIDNRPCNLRQTVEVAEKLGYEVLTPPEELLGTGVDEKNFGEPEKLWQWLEENSAGADAAVISADAMIYGSLVASRKHDLTSEEILRRAEKFSQLKKTFPYLPLYTFATIMRTPTTGVTGSKLEPEYYAQYGKAIFEYTVLLDKQEVTKLTRAEQKTFAWLDYYIPADVKNFWFERREKNFSANKFLADLLKAGTFEYLLIGCDDNAAFSQTHLESRHLKTYAENLPRTQFQVTNGADELGMLMISRAVNKNLNEIPFVAVSYNSGKGGDTVPSYSNAKISADIEDAIFAAGALPIPAPERADLVLAVNTNADGKTFEAMSAKNTGKPRRSTKNFLQLVKSFAEKNYPVGVIDISFANGADNALMNQLREKNLQFQLQAYGGWNTATNSAGFLIGSGVLTKFMTEREKNSLLLTRYFDDWAYQANIRKKLSGTPAAAKTSATELVRDFAEKNFRLPAGATLKNISVNFPWDRFFEADVNFKFE